MRGLGWITLALLLSSCVPEEAGVEPIGDVPTRTQIEECHAEGGEIVPGGLLPWACEIPLMDGGKSCSTGSDCEGLCMAETAQCSAVTPIFGCYPILEGGEEVTICVD